MSTKFSQLPVINKATFFNLANRANIYLAGVNQNLVSNFKVTADHFVQELSSVGSGAEVYKETTDYTDHTFRTLVNGSNKLAITENTNDITIDVTEGNIVINNLSGTLTLAKGGTGQSLTDPGSDSFLVWDNTSNTIKFATINTGLQLSGTNINNTITQTTIPLSTKGDIMVRDASANQRLAVGTNGYVLEADSTQTLGVKWAEKGKIKVDSAATEGYLGATSSTGVLQTTNKLSYVDGGDYVTLSVNEANLDPSLIPNNLIINHTATDDIDIKGGGTLADSHGFVAHNTKVWKFDDVASYSAITADAIIRIQIGGVTYKIEAESV